MALPSFLSEHLFGFFARSADSHSASEPSDLLVAYSLHHCFDVVKLYVEHLIIELWYNVRGAHRNRNDHTGILQGFRAYPERAPWKGFSYEKELQLL